MIYLKNSESTQEVFIPKMGGTRPTYTRGYNDGYNDGIKHQKSLLEPLYVTSNGIYETDNGFSEVTVNVQKSGDVVTKPLNVQPTITDVKDNELVYNPLEYDADAFNIVNINVSNLKEGYKEEQKALLEDLNVTQNGTYTNENGYKSVNVNVEQSSNLEDKIITPQTNEVDGNGWIYVYPNEGYDGMREVAMQTGDLKNSWYNEGYEQGKLEGGGSELVLGHQLEIINSNGRHIFYPQDNGWDGFDFFEVEVEVDVPTTAKLQDVWVEPTMADVDGNNLLVYAPNTGEGYDGLSRVVVNPINIYNEGYEQGKSEGDGVVYNKLSAEFELYSNYSLEISDSNALIGGGGNKPQYIITSRQSTSYLWSNSDVNKCVLGIEENAFSNLNSIKKVKLITINGIGERAFKNAASLEEIEYAFESVGFESGYFSTIKEEAFSGCSRLSKIIWRISNPEFEGDNIFNGLPENGTLYLEENVDENPWLERLPNGWGVERL